MKKLLYISALLLLCACGGSSIKKGQTIRLKKDVFAASSYSNAVKLRGYLVRGKNDECMKMYYAGDASYIEENDKVTVIEIKDDFCLVREGNGNAWWVKDKDLE